MWLSCRDKKSRRAEKQKGKGKKDEELPKSARQSSPNGNDQSGDDIIVDPPLPVHEEVIFRLPGST